MRNKITFFAIAVLAITALLPAPEAPGPEKQKASIMGDRSVEYNDI